MPMLTADSAEAARIDAALRPWRQGDIALVERWFVHVGDPARPLTWAAAETTEAGPQALMSEVAGLIVVTQTCDVVRSCVERPFVEVCPLVEVSEEHLHDVRRARCPAYAFVPALADRRLVADLDRVMAVEKSIVADWKRTPGWAVDGEARGFAQALARKRVRFAFPDDFTALTRKLQGRMVEKHERNSDEGRALRALREIRVQASPSWHSSAVTLMFWFVRHEEDTDFEGKSWAPLVEAWLKLGPVPNSA